MSNCAIVGINWGDEGKGRMVDLISSDYDVVIRYQGGGNAGHTVINEHGKFALHLLPSGIFRPGVVSVIGNGVAVDPESLMSEIDYVRDHGIKLTPDNLKISSRASLLLPWHKQLDCLEEQRLADKKYGSTKQGIAPFYSDKYQKKTVLAGEILNEKAFFEHLIPIMEWKNLTIEGVYNAEPTTLADLKAWYNEYCMRLMPFIGDLDSFYDEVRESGKNVLFEAQLGALRDIDFGIHPYTTSSSTIAAYAPIGAGCPDQKLDEVIGVVKAYSTCVGEGPFTSEWFGEEADLLREHGGEYGAKTGRPRRVGSFDVVATRYGVKKQGATAIALTKMDVLSYMDRIPICTKYKLGDTMTDRFPFPSLLASAEPHTQYLPGWKTDISSVRRFEDLPLEAQDYVLYIEEQIGCYIKYISVGPERDSIIIR
jgi:adenylosuccinate synthase